MSECKQNSKAVRKPLYSKAVDTISLLDRKKKHTRMDSAPQTWLPSLEPCTEHVLRAPQPMRYASTTSGDRRGASASSANGTPRICHEAIWPVCPTWVFRVRCTEYIGVPGAR